MIQTTSQMKIQWKICYMHQNQQIRGVQDMLQKGAQRIEDLK